MKYLFLVIIIVFCMCSIQAQDSIYRDTVYVTLAKGFGEIKTDENAKGFKKVYRSKNNDILDSRPQEITVYVTNEDSSSLALIFEVINPFTVSNIVHYSHAKPDTWIGTSRNERKVFRIKPKEQQFFTFRIMRGVSREGYKILLWENTVEFPFHNRIEDIELTVFLCTNILFLILISFYILIASNNKPHLWWYILYVALGVITILFHNGIIQIGLVNSNILKAYIENPFIEELITVHIYSLCIVCVLRFCRVQFKTATLYSTIHKITSVLQYSLITSIILNTAYTTIVPSHTIHILLGISQNMITFFIIMVLIYLVIKDWRFILLDKDNRIFIIAFSLNRITALFLNIKILGFISHWEIFDIYIISPNSFHSDMLLLSGMFFEIIVVFFWIVYQTWYFEPKLAAEKIKSEQEKQLKLLQDLANTRQNALASFINGAEQERQKMAENFHDGFQVYLSLARGKLRNMLGNGEKQPSKYNKQEVESVIFDIDKIQTIVKETIRSLDNKQIKEKGLVNAIEDFVSQSQNTHTKFHFIANQISTLNYDTEIQLFRIIQIAVDNVLKYAQAEECFIQLLENEESIILSIEDNGTGFDLTEKVGYGLSNIENRAKMIGAEVHIETNLNKGTTIFIAFPISLA